MPTDNATLRKSLRLWPGVVLAVVLVIARYVLLPLTSEVEISSFPLPAIFLGIGLLCSVAIVLWWLFFSRAPWSERLGAIVLMIAAVFAIRPLVHESLIGGMMGNWLYVYSTPLLSLALVVGAVAGRRLTTGARRATLAAAILLAAASFTLIRTAGVQGVGAQLHWRWTPTPEQLLLAQAKDEPLDSARGKPPSTAPTDTPAASAKKPSEPSAPKTLDKPSTSTSSARRARRSPEGCRRSQGRTGRSAGCRDASCGACNERAGSRASRMAGLPRTRTRQHHPRRADQDRLVGLAARRDVAAGDRTWLVVLRRRRRLSLHAGAARRGRSRCLLQGLYGRAGLATPRSSPVLGVERWRRPARDAGDRQRSRLFVWRHRNPQRARRPELERSYGRATRRPTPRSRPRSGVSPALPWCSTTSSSWPLPAGSPPTTPLRANRAGSVRLAAPATAHRTS